LNVSLEPSGGINMDEKEVTAILDSIMQSILMLSPGTVRKAALS